MLITTESRDPGVRSAVGFAIRRFFRIWPLYALITIIVATGFRSQNVSAYLNSLLFLPTLTPTGFWDPAIYSGWTLNFEMYFYVLTAICLLTPWKTRLAACIAFGLGLFSLTINDTIYYFASIVMEFALGALLGVLWNSRAVWKKLIRIRWPLLLMSVCLFVAVGRAVGWDNPHVIAAPHMSVRLLYFDAVLPRSIGWGIPSFFLMLSVMLFEDRIPAGLSRLGDYTYSVYLLHVPIIQGALYLKETLPGATVSTIVGTHLVPVAIVTATAVTSVVTYHLVEVPMIRLGSALARRFEGRRAPSSAAQVPPSI